LKITTKFAFNGLILSILGVHSPFASAYEKSVIDVASLKNCSSQDVDSENPCKENELATKYGKLILARHIPDTYGSTLFFRGKLISNAELGVDLTFKKQFNINDNEVFLLNMTDGNAPEDYMFLKLMADGSVKFSNTIRSAIDDSTKGKAFNESHRDLIAANDGELKTLQIGNKIQITLADNYKGVHRVAIYENDQISIKRMEGKKEMDDAKEKDCQGTYGDYKDRTNYNAGKNFKCDMDEALFDKSKNYRSHLFFNDNFKKSILYTCKTRNLIDYPNFKNSVCNGK